MIIISSIYKQASIKLFAHTSRIPIRELENLFAVHPHTPTQRTHSSILSSSHNHHSKSVQNIISVSIFYYIVVSYFRLHLLKCSSSIRVCECVHLVCLTVQNYDKHFIYILCYMNMGCVCVCACPVCCAPN